MQENNNEEQKIIEKPTTNQKVEENVQKKKKKKNKTKKKQGNKTNNEEKPNANANLEKEAEEEPALNNHEDLLQLLSQNDSVLFEKLLNATPDFSRFDQINNGFNEKIASMNKMIDDIQAGNYQDIPFEEGF